MDNTLKDLAQEYWDLILEQSPTTATLLGDHRFDDRIEDLSQERETWFIGRLSSIIERAEAIDPAPLGRTDRVTQRMLLFEAGKHRELSELGIVELHSDQMLGPHATIMTALAAMNFPQSEQALAAVERFRHFDLLLETASGRFQAGLAKGRSPARLTVERSLHIIDKYLGTPIDADPIVNLSGPENWEGEAAWRDDLRHAVEAVVRPAFVRYRDLFQHILAPAARADDRAGLVWLEDGESIYRTLARTYTTTERSPDEIHDVGRDIIERQLPAEYAKVGERALGISDTHDLVAALRSDPALRFSEADEIVDVARRALARATASMDEWFGRLPKAGCELQVVPEFLAADAPRAYYYPPTTDGSRGGIHFVNTREPQQQARYDEESVAFHESIPGHHLQIAISQELDHIPPFQQNALVTAYVEGWGLYAERLADEMGLYTSDLDRLGMLSADAWRAGRLVVDTGIHSKGWSRRQAIDYLLANTANAPDDIMVEVDRYVAMPGQALGYKIGQLEISRLRKEAEQRLGNRFEVKAFHDVVLTSGAVTLDVLGELVEEWVSASR